MEVPFFSCLVFLFDYNFHLCAEFANLVLHVVNLFLLGLITYSNHSSKNITCQIPSRLMSEEFDSVDCFVCWKCIVFLLFLHAFYFFFGSPTLLETEMNVFFCVWKLAPLSFLLSFRDTLSVA